MEFLCNSGTAEGREVEVLGCFEVLQGLREVCSVFGWVGDGGDGCVSFGVSGAVVGGCEVA